MSEKKYRIQTWKLTTEGSYSSEEEAIKDLSDKYMRCSKSDPPGEHFIEMLYGSTRDVSNIGKGVFLYVFEKNTYGVEQWVLMARLTIYPFKKEHWWKTDKEFHFEECEFRYTKN